MSNSGSSSSTAGTISELTNVAESQAGLGNTVQGQGGQIYSPAYQQYVSGIQGQLTPAQQALVTQNLGTMNTGTTGTYSNLGLGGSTMEGQDLNANALKSLAEQSNINFQNESLGLQGLGEALGYYGQAATDYSGAATSLKDVGSLETSNLSSLTSALSSLGNKSSSGSGLGSLFGSAAGGLGSLFGSSGGAASGVIDTGLFDVGSGAAGAGAALLLA